MDNFEDGMTFGELLASICANRESEYRCVMSDGPDYDLLSYDDDFWDYEFRDEEDREPTVGETFQSSPLMEGRPKRRRRNLGRIPRDDRYKNQRKREGVRVVRERDSGVGETVRFCQQECPPQTRRMSIFIAENHERYLDWWDRQMDEVWDFGSPDEGITEMSYRRQICI